MHLLTITDADFGGLHNPDGKRSVRTASRAVLKRPDGKIALMHVQNHCYHKLPGGGVDLGESVIVALHREIGEEVGCTCVVGDIIGAVHERRDKHDLFQINYCFHAVTEVMEGYTPDFCQEEIDDDFVLEWYTMEQAIALMVSETPETYAGKFIQQRDLHFLQSCVL